MKRSLFLAAIAFTALAGCTDESYVGDQSLLTNGDGAISFTMSTPAMTRAENTGATAAGHLGNQFIVYGEKGSNSYTAAPGSGNLVFPNYQVNYGTNTAYTTTSNTKDWEYVGYKYQGNTSPTLDYPLTNITIKATSDGTASNADGDAQTIKYWDYGASHYVFTAVSADKEDIANSRVKIQKNLFSTSEPASTYDRGYTITLSKSGTEGSYVYPKLNKLYISDRLVINNGTGTDRNAANAYGGNVKLSFRNLMSQIRAGVYETISGYDITAISFYVANGSGAQTAVAQVNSTNAFGAICPNISTATFEGTVDVTYYASGSIVNQPKVTARTNSGTKATNLILGTNMSSISTATDNQLGKTATSPTWDTSAGAFTEVLPQINNDGNLKLKCDYTLWNSVSGETINIEGATAEVPAQYLQWKPNYKYTYLFKITDDKLYPITFDAVEIVAEDGQAEYITTVTQPSITTFGVVVNSSDEFQAYQTGKDEYQVPSGDDKLDIYATIMDGSSVATPELGTNVNIYKNIVSSDATNFPVTEASLAEAIAETGASAEKITYTLDNSTFASVKSGSGTGNGIPSENGNEITGVPAIKLENLTAGTYAVEYFRGAVGDVFVSAGTEAKYVSGTKYYTDNTGATEVDTSSFVNGVTDVSSYFIKNDSYKPAVKVYKIIKVAAAS